jgi:hypothetical protein
MASTIRATRFGKLGTMLAVTSNLSMLQKKKKLLTANIVPTLRILATLMMKAICVLQNVGFYKSHVV